MSLFSQILQFLLTGITIGTIYGMVALGFNIIYNATGIINFAQGEFVMLGGMFMVWFTTVLKIPMIAAFALSVIMVTLIGALFERLAIYPLKRPSVLILIMITLAGSIIMKGSAMLFWGKETYTLPHFSGEEPFYLFGATILPQTLWILGIMFVVVIILAGFFNFTMLGKAMRACAVNPTAASLVGISVKKMVLLILCPERGAWSHCRDHHYAGSAHGIRQRGHSGAQGFCCGSSGRPGKRRRGGGCRTINRNSGITGGRAHFLWLQRRHSAFSAAAGSVCKAQRYFRRERGKQAERILTRGFKDSRVEGSSDFCKRIALESLIP